MFVFCKELENRIRSTLNDIYFGKTKDIVNGLRTTVTSAERQARELFKRDLAGAIKGRSLQLTDA